MAAAARTHNAEVTVVERFELPLLPVLGAEIAASFRDLHAKHGVRWRLGVGVTGFVGTDGVVSAVRLDDGTEIPADVVVVAIGAAPQVGLAKAAGLAVSACGARVRPGLVPAQRGEAGTHPTPQPSTAR